MLAILNWSRKITSKLIIVILVSFIAIATIAYEGLMGLSRLNDEIAVLVEDNMAQITQTSDMQYHVDQARTRTMLALDASVELEDYDVIMAHTEAVNHHHALTMQSMDNLRNLQLSAAFLRTLVTTEQAIQTLFTQGLNPVIDDIEMNDYAAARTRLNDTVVTQLDSLQAQLRQLTAYSMEEARATYALSQQTASRLFTGVIVVLIASSLVLGLMAFFTVKRIAFALSGLQKTASSVANGNLIARVDIGGQDEFSEVANAVNHIAERYQQTVSLIRCSADALANAVSENTQLAQSTTANVESQQQQIQAIAAATEELATTVREVAESAISAADASQTSDCHANHGQTIVDEAITRSVELASTIEEAKETIVALGQQSKHISVVSDTIRDISEQTNLLALNAAIEAARAGGYGRGFAVVAEEVRSLAQRTHQATHDIQAMIADLQQGCDSAIDKMNTGDNFARQSSEKTQQAGTSLASIVEAVATIAAMNTQIATAAEQQAIVTDDVNQTVASISLLSDSTSVDAKKSLDTSKSISELATALTKEVAAFAV
ncbi:methyl-accepting chemotaxis protein [Thaumasiovibrio subtropicus]|uniref:methyl-accepting chemotaxis protein n=1 Tax=Thaumasiovibrio subtropicus TaxID=1891207 RepID=UPI00131BFFE7|nr:methyl-accepting chemotaxis protein [Thaumasiovibrio subtropicus]